MVPGICTFLYCSSCAFSTLTWRDHCVPMEASAASALRPDWACGDSDGVVEGVKETVAAPIKAEVAAYWQQVVGGGRCARLSSIFLLKILIPYFGRGYLASFFEHGSLWLAVTLQRAAHLPLVLLRHRSGSPLCPWHCFSPFWPPFILLLYIHLAGCGSAGAASPDLLTTALAIAVFRYSIGRWVQNGRLRQWCERRSYQRECGLGFGHLYCNRGVGESDRSPRKGNAVFVASEEECVASDYADVRTVNWLASVCSSRRV